MELTYGELELFLAEIHKAAPEKRTALKGRLKHFQRLGWPEGTNKGKGARVKYGFGQTMMLAMGMELLQLGLTPERVVLQLRYSGGYLADGFAEALKQHGSDGDDVYYIFAPESLIGLRGMDDEEGTSGLRSAMAVKSEIGEVFKTALFGASRRSAFINMSAILAEFVTYFADKGLETAADLRQPIMKWQIYADQKRKETNDPDGKHDFAFQVPIQDGHGILRGAITPGFF